MVCELPWLQEMDINPLTLDAEAGMALDARVVIDPAKMADGGRYEQLAIHPYPVHLVQKTRLRDGSDLIIRPIRPEDAEAEKRFVENLSEHSRRMRFFSGAKILSPRLLARLTQIDYGREMALVAWLRENSGEHMVGVARYSPMPDGRNCEFAVAVDDAWHGRGLGKQLFRLIAESARAAGYHRLVGFVCEENGKMIRMMRSLDAVEKADHEDKSRLVYSVPL